jgi:hypothetical protein
MLKNHLHWSQKMEKSIMISRSHCVQTDHCYLLNEVCLVYKAGHRYHKFYFNPEHWHKFYTSYNTKITERLPILSGHTGWTGGGI